jgi:pimeloyl-ACP methyl ester carboxylesterase
MKDVLINNIEVNDISIAYKIYGEEHKGSPVLLVMGYGCTIDMWPPDFIEVLSQDYKVIVFDNRGMGFTTSSEMEFSIELFAEDTAELLNRLGISRAHMLGWSMGSFICQELVIKYPSMVEKLILYGGYCGGKEAIQTDILTWNKLTDRSGTIEERVERMFGLLFPSDWLGEQKDFTKILPPLTEPVWDENIGRQARALEKWKGTFGSLNKIKNPTLLITGTEDVIILPDNVFVMAKEIKGSSIVQIPGGGHGVIYQYTKQFADYIMAFLQE